MSSTHAWPSRSLASLSSAAEPLVLASEVLGVDEQAEALVEGQLADLGTLLLFGPGRAERVEAQGLEFLDRRFVQHDAFLLQL